MAELKHTDTSGEGATPKTKDRNIVGPIIVFGMLALTAMTIMLWYFFAPTKGQQPTPEFIRAAIAWSLACAAFIGLSATLLKQRKS